MTPFRFLHAADIHLDSPLIGLADVEGRVAERIRTAPRAAFELLVDQAIEEEIDFLVIAGDLYDGTWRDYKTGPVLCRADGPAQSRSHPGVSPARQS